MKYLKRCTRLMSLTLMMIVLTACQSGVKNRVAPIPLIPPPQILHDWSQPVYSEDPVRSAFVKDYMKQQCVLGFLNDIRLNGCSN